MNRKNERGRGTFVRGRTTLMVYALVGYFAYMETVLGPLMPFLRRELNLGFAVAGLHFSAFASGAVLIGLTGDRVVAKWGRRVSLWIGASGMSVGAVVLASSPVAVGTILGTFFMGTFGALLLVTTEAFLADRHGDWRTVAISESNTVASACAIGAPLLVGFSASLGPGWRAALIPPVVLLCLIAVRFGSTSSTLGGSRPPEQKPPGDEDFGERRLPPQYWAFWGLVSLGVATEWSVGYWGADFLVGGKGLSPPGAATALTTFFVAMLSGRVLGSRLARRLSSYVLLLASLCLALASFLLFWLAGRPEFALAGLFAMGLGVGNLYPMGVSSALSAAPGKANVAAARLAVGGGGAVLVAPLVLGALANRVGIEIAFGIVVPMLLAAVALAIVGMLYDRRSMPVVGDPE